MKTYRHFTRWVALLLVLTSLLGLCACSSKTEDDPGTETDSTAETPVSLASGNPYCDLLGIAPEDRMLTVNGEDITAEEYFYWLQSAYDYMVTNYGQVSDWSAQATEELTVSEYLLADALEAAKFYHIFTTTAMEQYPDLALTAEEQAEIDDYLAQYITAYFTDEAGFQAALDEALHIGPELFTFANCTVPALYNKLFTLMYDAEDYLSAAGEDEVQAYVDSEITGKGYIRAAHILIKTVDDDYEPLPEEEIAEAKAWAEELLALLNDGADFFELMQQYSQDTGKESYPTGYYFNADSGFVQEFYDAAMALEENEMSGLVESVYGYHIILRLPPDPADFAEEVCWLQYEDIVQAWADGSQVTFSDVYAQVDPAVLFAEDTGEDTDTPAE